ncbi:MAG: MBL fold metallo-hydrolase RNA specificity domain-containing protein, partial [Eubacteriales bacterium]|nr:MBL fold metallo-hydrolase RNA specificity domain-containing protein [Eubacteriales bacterium]
FRVYPQQLFLVHGEAKAAQKLKERLLRDTGIVARIPTWKETVTIHRGQEQRDKLTQACQRFWTDLQGYLQGETSSYDDVLAKVTEFQQYLARRAEGAKKE